MKYITRSWVYLYWYCSFFSVAVAYWRYIIETKGNDSLVLFVSTFFCPTIYRWGFFV